MSTPFGRLAQRQHHQPMGEINVTPLVDVMLVLVVILIVTAPLLASAIRLELPRSDAAQAASAGASLTLTLQANGQIWLNEQLLSEETLRQQLADTGALQPDTEIQLRADHAVPYGQVVHIMGLAQKAGLSRIGFVAEVPTAAPPAALGLPGAAKNAAPAAQPR